MYAVVTTGNIQYEAQMLMLVRELTTAPPPAINAALAIKLAMRPRTVKRIWVTIPCCINTMSRNLCALLARYLMRKAVKVKNRV